MLFYLTTVASFLALCEASYLSEIVVCECWASIEESSFLNRVPQQFV